MVIFCSPAGGQVLSRDLDHAVYVDVKGNLDLGFEGEAAARFPSLNLPNDLLSGQSAALALQHVDLHRGLHGTCRGKDLALAGGDHAVAGDQRG